MSCIRSCYDKDSSNFGHDDCPTCIHKDSPPQRKPLTDEQIYELWTEQGLANSYDIYSLKEHVRRAARAIEAAHGIKGEE